jgi:hypothetical protein
MIPKLRRLLMLDLLLKKEKGLVSYMKKQFAGLVGLDGKAELTRDWKILFQGELYSQYRRRRIGC